jgi:hypothetical protein
MLFSVRSASFANRSESSKRIVVVAAVAIPAAVSAPIDVKSHTRDEDHGADQRRNQEQSPWRHPDSID